MLLSIIRERFADAVSGTSPAADGLLDTIRPAQDPKFGDFQANLAMPLAKQLGKKPRDVAAEIVSNLKIDDICQPPEIAGPGFINLRLKDEFIIQELQTAITDEERLGIPKVNEPKTFVVDYSGPNVAKPMHVGHLRSTVLGNAVCRLLTFYGHRVISDNHLGDWGTQFGMIIYGYRNFLDKKAYQENPVEELSRVYRLVRQKMDDEPSVADAVLNETVKLHSGNEENLKIWREVLPYSRDEIDKIYKRLNITFDYTLGESFYHPFLAPLVNDLLKCGIAVETDGAVGIFFEGDDVPMLIRKKDGAFLYGTTDLATVEYRTKEFKPDVILYITDFRQDLHFKHLFKAVRLINRGTGAAADVELVHIKFGTVLGEDGKPFKTRSGDTVGLNGLLDEAEAKALEVVNTGVGSGTSAAAGKETARKIGLGAVIYADLSQNRESDYVFSYDKMLAMTGNTAAYMQYAVARVKSIFSKGNIGINELRAGNSVSRLQIAEPAERSLALELLKFGEAVEASLRDCRPNGLTAYLFELANKYSTFFEQCPVLKAENETVKTSRLLLCDLTARTLEKGLNLLGIETVERM
ncbi:MAG: arginine--tRNA ligase [Planctomycetaceae bacterium]|jgi:arginyl-tRNA synthetase|nr:arginine--tRNA ligase [Planctomycetaceae bacterium]